MSAFNVVRLRAKPGKSGELVAFWRDQPFEDLPGLERMALVSTGERDYCVVGEWSTMEALVAARPKLIASLDRFRGMLEDLGGGLGITDPVSGEAVVQRSRG